MVDWSLWKHSLAHCSCYCGPLGKQGTHYTLQLLMGGLFKSKKLYITVAGPLKVRYLHIAIGVWGLFDSIVVAHCSCCWCPLWKQGTCILKLLLGLLWKQRCLNITIAVEGLFENKVLTHDNCCWGPLWKQGIIHYNCCWGPLRKQGTHTL